MSTRSCVGYPVNKDWAARYIHFDGYPIGVGKEICNLYNYFNCDYEKLTNFLFNEHPQGFSSLEAENYVCICHYSINSSNYYYTSEFHTKESAARVGCEFAYILSEDKIMTIYYEIYPRIKSNWIKLAEIDITCNKHLTLADWELLNDTAYNIGKYKVPRV